MTPPASTEPMYLIGERELGGIFSWGVGVSPYESKDPDSRNNPPIPDGEKIISDIRARGPVQQAPAPTNHLAIPCPKCGKWIFRANVDEGYTLFCSDDECGWKQKIVAQQAPAITTIRMRFPLRDLPTVESAKWQEGYRERLIKQIIDGEKISTSEEWHEYFKSISKTCPSCFCPNLEEHYSDQYNSKGFHCPACGNSFSLPILQYSLVDDAALIAQEREKWERERDQKYVLTLSALREISADVELKEYRKSCIHDPVCQWLCTAGNCPFHIALDRHNATIAAQAREDVLRELEQWSNENATVFDPNDGESYVLLDPMREKIELLRQGKKQERDPE